MKHFVCLAGVGAGSGWREPYVTERDARLGAARRRWQDLSLRQRSTQEEQEWCLLQWRPDSPAGDPGAHARALWRTRPTDTVVDRRANRELTADSATLDLLGLAQHVQAPVVLVQGADDPRPWTATDELLAALRRARRVVLDQAGHAPWAERPTDVQAAVVEALRG